MYIEREEREATVLSVFHLRVPNRHRVKYFGGVEWNIIFIVSKGINDRWIQNG
jgi:hypothetical protein